MSTHGPTLPIPVGPPDPSWVPGHPDFESRLNAFLDGQLTAADAAAFERFLQDRPPLHAELRSALALEASLRRTFDPPPSIQPPHTPGAPGVAARLPRPRWLRWGVGIAALLALGIILQQLLAPPAGPTWVRGDALLCMQSLQQKWDSPKWVCKDDAEFAAFTRDKFGQGWTIKPLDGLKLVGWTYTERLTDNNYASALMAEYNGTRIALVVDEKRFDRHVSIPADHSIYAHRKRCGQSMPIVMYELSPLDKPLLLDRVEWVVPESPSHDPPR